MPNNCKELWVKNTISIENILSLSLVFGSMNCSSLQPGGLVCHSYTLSGFKRTHLLYGVLF